MSLARRLVALLTLVALLLPGLMAQPVAARQCLRVQAKDYCIEMANPVAQFAEHAAPAPALLPEEIQLRRPVTTRQTWTDASRLSTAQTEALPQLRPPRG